jgi:hypothetical protein
LENRAKKFVIAIQKHVYKGFAPRKERRKGLAFSPLYGIGFAFIPYGVGA